MSINRNEGSWIFRLFHLFHKTMFIEERLFTKYNEYITDDELKKFIWDNLDVHGCKEHCKGIENKTIMGKQFDKVCFCWPIKAKDPDGAVLECSEKGWGNSGIHRRNTW